MKHKYTLLLSLPFILSSCVYSLGFEPVRLYNLSASLKYYVDNNISQDELETQLFTSYENMSSYFDEYTYSYGGVDKEQIYKDILENIDFNISNLFGCMRQEGTSSSIHAVSIKDNNITIYHYTPDAVDTVIAYKWLIFEVDKKYSLQDFNIEYKRMNKKQVDCLIDNYTSKFYF